MRFLSILLGIFLFVPVAHAIPVPVRPILIAPYLGKVLDKAEGMLNPATGSTGSCGPGAIRERAEIVDRIQSIFLYADRDVAQPLMDMGRSICFVSDARKMELYVRDLIRMSLDSATSCDRDAAYTYANVADMVWRELYALRLYGLNPHEQAPVTGTGFDVIPPSPLPADDDGICPYTSTYSQTFFRGSGCQEDTFLTTPPGDPAEQEEARLFTRIAQRISSTTPPAGMTGYVIQLRNLRTVTDFVLWDVSTFVRNMWPLRQVGQATTENINFSSLPPAPANIGESGCFGWTSDVTTGVVTGEGFARQNYFPFLLTKEFAEVFEYLHQKVDVETEDLEYVRRFAEEKVEADLDVPESYTSKLRDLNEFHLDVEGTWQLSVADARREMVGMAERLHSRTHAFVRTSVDLDNTFTVAGVTDPVNIPPLRSFVRKYGEFLLRMCTNRSCGQTIKRAIELSLRDECFPSFLKQRFFATNSGATILPPCRALIIP